MTGTDLASGGAVVGPDPAPAMRCSRYAMSSTDLAYGAAVAGPDPAPAMRWPPLAFSSAGTKAGANSLQAGKEEEEGAQEGGQGFWSVRQRCAAAETGTTTRGREPEAMSAEPETMSAEPETMSAEPETMSAEPEAMSCECSAMRQARKR
eukprot:2877120-Rhodomonas_salina.2